MSDHASINFDDLAPIEVPVSIGGKKYVLREASGDAACKWRNALLKSTKLGPEGKPSSIDGMADTEPLLVSLCLFSQNGKDESFSWPVPLATIRAWPNRVQKSLFDKAQEISDLGATAGVETKETLEEKMVELRAKLDKMRTNGQVDSAKNLPSVMRDGSA